MNKNEELLPYYEKATELLDYDAETGIFTWKASHRRVEAGSQAGSHNGRGYIQIQVDRKKLLAHRLAWYFTYGELPNVIDHTNGVRDDNHITNLRSCSQFENMQNQGKRSDNTSGYMGVTRDRGKWRAQISINGENKFLGRFDTKEQASEVYQTKAKEVGKEFYKKQSCK